MRRDAGEPGVATGRLAHPEAQAAGRRHDELVGSALPLRHVDPALRHVAVPDLPRRVSCRRTSTLPDSVLKTSRAGKISELNPGQRVSCLRTSVTFVYQDIGDVTEPAAPQYASEPPRTARVAVLDVETTGRRRRLRRAPRRDRGAGGLPGRRDVGARLGR